MLSDNEIIKALESLLDKMRAYESSQASIGKGLVEDIISMYDRQKAENERLQSDNVKLHTIIPKMLVEAKSEAIKEFAEKLIDIAVGNWEHKVDVGTIDNLVKEMVGDDNATH